ncbi:MAG: hypothetical protein ABIP89_10390 [Polyangiaceae bacterium]
MTDWRLARSLGVLQREVNAAHPDRPKSADGTIGDARHAATQSDHNPNPPHPGVVTAWDITTSDFTDALAEKLRLLGLAGHPVKYVIYKGRITTRDLKGWKPYSGYSQHFDHIHLSVSDDPAQYDRTDPWLKPAPSSEDIVTPADHKAIAAEVVKVLEPHLQRLAQYLAGDRDNAEFNDKSLGVTPKPAAP